MVWAARPSGEHYYFNERWYEFTGVSQGETLGNQWLAQIHPEDKDITWALWQQCLTTGEPYRTEFRLHHRSGQFRWVLARAQPLRNESGTIESWFGTSTDIQDIVNAREVLSRSREELEKQIELRTRERDRIWRLSNDLMKVCQLDGRLVSVNEAWNVTLGWSESDLLGRNYVDLVHPDDAERITNGLKAITQKPHNRSYEVRLRHHDGSYRLTAWTAVPEEGLLYSVGRDITEQRQLEDQLRQSQKMEAVGQLTGGIAHDFNNLLTGIIGSLDLMQRRYETGRTDDLQRYMSAAVTSAQRAAALTQRLLAFSRRQALDLKPVNINTLVASMEELLRRTIGEKLTLNTVLTAGLWPALTDTNQLESALLNLVINARDAMPDGGQITISTSSAHFDGPLDEHAGDVTPGDYIVLSVSDTGTGMSPEVIERAFEPFFTTKPIGQGTGLGLSMIYGYAKQTKGHVRIFSTPGKGTSVKLYLPRHRGALDEELVATSLEVLHGSGETVLVVEDEGIVRSLIVEVLSELGYTALEAIDAQEAIPLLQSPQKIDLMISDVGLPGMNGRQLADVARTIRPDLKILFATGYAEGAQVDGYLGDSMEIITKPFNVDALASKIQGMIRTLP
jgi:PAS domain S-box-containing protein